jgi:ribosomal protein S18 acetylase RimI-like enzyme
MSDPMIRSATPDDVDSALELWLASGGEPTVTDTPEGMRRLLETDPDALLVAESAGAMVGSLIAAWDGWRGSFYRLTVHPDHRRRGLATALLRAAERRLSARGAVRLTAIVTGDDPVAVAFWTAAGYEPQGNRTRYVRHLRD